MVVWIGVGSTVSSGMTSKCSQLKAKVYPTFVRDIKRISPQKIQINNAAVKT